MGQELEQNDIIIVAKGRKSFRMGGEYYPCQVCRRSSRMRIRKKLMLLGTNLYRLLIKLSKLETFKYFWIYTNFFVCFLA
jgi:hypothetical protein